MQPGEQQLTGVAAERVRVLCDDSHGGVEEVAEDDVVEAGERHVALAAEVAQREDRADGDEVLGGEQRRRRVGRAEQRERGLASLVAVGEPEQFERRRPSDAGTGECVVIAREPLGGGEEGRPVAQERDPAVTGVDEVLDGGAATAAVVADDRVTAQ